MHPDTPTNRVHIQWTFIFKMHIKNQKIIYHFCHDCMTYNASSSQVKTWEDDNAYNEQDSKVGIYHNYNIYIIHVYLYLSQEWRKENV